MKRGFSLLEVMMAVAILGLSLSVILSAQGGISAANKAAANMGRAITAARCRMSEVELKLLKNGYGILDEVISDEKCCEDVEDPGVTCDTRTEKVELPPMSSTSSDGGAGLASLAALSGGDAGLAGGAGLNFDAGIGGIGAGMQSQIMGAGGTGGIIQSLMGMVYPMLKSTLEASIRRITVVVKWKEGPNAREFTLVQYVTNPQQASLLGGFGMDGGLPMLSPSGAGGAAAPGGQRTTGAQPPVTR